MMFASRLRVPVMRGEVTCSLCISHSPRLKVYGRYALARHAGFSALVDLLKVAKPRQGERVFIVEFFNDRPGSSGTRT